MIESNRRNIISNTIVIVILAIGCVCTPQRSYGAQVRIGEESFVQENERSRYNRYVNWRPANNETVHLNPPRISWPYWPDFPNNWNAELHTFQFQISSRDDMSQPIVDVSCDYNFYNTIPALQQGREWFWRVGYDVGTDHEVWSPVRSIKIANNSLVWDRSALAKPGFAQRASA